MAYGVARDERGSFRGLNHMITATIPRRQEARTSKIVQGCALIVRAVNPDITKSGAIWPGK
jgi:hypothetical protein